MTQPPSADFAMQRSSRDAADAPTALAGWLATQLPVGAEPDVTLHTGIDSHGMSSETLVPDATWTQNGERRTSHIHSLNQVLTSLATAVIRTVGAVSA